MCPRLQTGLDQRFVGLDERPGAVEQHVDIIEVLAGLRGVEHPGVLVEFDRQPPGSGPVAAADDHVHPAVGHLLGDEFAGVAVGTVDEDSHGNGFDSHHKKSGHIDRVVDYSTTSATVASAISTRRSGSMGNTASDEPAAAQTVSNWSSVSST